MQFKDLNISRTCPRWCLESTILLCAPRRGEDKGGRRRTRRGRGPPSDIRLPDTLVGLQPTVGDVLRPKAAEDAACEGGDDEEHISKNRLNVRGEGEGRELIRQLRTLFQGHTFDISKPANNDQIETCGCCVAATGAAFTRRTGYCRKHNNEAELSQISTQFKLVSVWL